MGWGWGDSGGVVGVGLPMAVCTPDTIGIGKPAQTLQKPLHIYAAALASGASPRSRDGPLFPLMAAAHRTEERSG